MERSHDDLGCYRVLLRGIEDNNAESRETFCRHLSKRYQIPYSSVKDIVDRCPIILRKNLSFRKAEVLARALKQHGALVSVEKRSEDIPVLLESDRAVSPLLSVESARVSKTEGRAWQVTGSLRNISESALHDVWVLIQLFEDPETLLTFEEVPIPINPLPPRERSPFKALVGEDLPPRQVSITLKNSAGNLIAAEDRRKRREWIEVEIEWAKDSSSIGPVPSEQKQLAPELATAESGPSSAQHACAPEMELEISSEFPGRPDQEAPHDEGPGLTLDEPALDSAASHNTTPTASDGNGSAVEAPPELTPVTVMDPLTSEVDYAPLGAGKDFSEFPWMESFRNAVTTYYQNSSDPFVAWFRLIQSQQGFESGSHRLVTLLAHARFDQRGQTVEGLENTRRVWPLLARSNPPLDEIPPLEGTEHFSAESWKNLFFKAIPRLHKIAENIATNGTWDAVELERLVQIIPHMSFQTSRKAVRWMSELTRDDVKIDFSKTPVIIGEALYRVAVRLGVVSPQFDPYQNENSMGYIKIQSFAKAAFPQDPSKIEDPMTTLGNRGGEGHCDPIPPRCEGCLFESFCPRLPLSSVEFEKGDKRARASS